MSNPYLSLDEMLIRQREDIRQTGRQLGIEEPVIRDDELIHMILTTYNFQTETLGWDEDFETMAEEAALRLPYTAPIWVRDGEQLVMVVPSPDGRRRATVGDLAEFDTHAPTPLLQREGPID